jgi:hypothetical protein
MKMTENLRIVSLRARILTRTPLLSIETEWYDHII